jgi:hypothetical protein
MHPPYPANNCAFRSCYKMLESCPELPILSSTYAFSHFSLSSGLIPIVSPFLKISPLSCPRRSLPEVRSPTTHFRRISISKYHHRHDRICQLTMVAPTKKHTQLITNSTIFYVQPPMIENVRPDLFKFIWSQDRGACSVQDSIRS